jgi:histidinol phosphatase-like PHP family hydrolase
MGMSHLSDEEKTALEAMSDEEKQAFLAEKKEERKAQKEVKQAIITKVLAGIEISSDEKATLEAMTAEHEGKNEGKGK